MNARKSLILKITAATFFAVLVLGATMSAFSTAPNVSDEQRRSLLSKLDTALAAIDRELINTARREIESIPPRFPADKSTRAEQLAKFQLMLGALQKVDSVNDKNFDPEDSPMRNVTPPKSKDGRGYDSGISPDSIQDTDARNEYKRMIAANKAKIERYAKQIALYNARWDWIRVIAVFRVDFFNDSTDDVNAIEQLVDLEIKDPGLKKEVTELLAVKKK